MAYRNSRRREVKPGYKLAESVDAATVSFPGNRTYSWNVVGRRLSQNGRGKVGADRVITGSLDMLNCFSAIEEA